METRVNFFFFHNKKQKMILLYQVILIKPMTIRSVITGKDVNSSIRLNLLEVAKGVTRLDEKYRLLSSKARCW